MNITFRREGTKVQACITIPVPNYDARVFYFSFECNGEVYASLLTEEMRKQLNDEVEAIRKDEYETGWHDHASHKQPKRQWFASSFAWRNRR